jgi:hypothetical protein
MSAILGVLSSLPQIISLLTEIWAYLNKISGNDPAGYLLKLGSAFSQLNAAQTQEQHAAAAKALADSIAGSPAK